MEIQCLVTPTCHFPGQSRKKFAPCKAEDPASATEARPSCRIVPPTREERIACVKLGLAGAAVLVGTPAAMSVLHLIGAW